jgi:hypothetical protein
LDEVEAKTIKKPSSDRSAKDRRNTLFRVLDGVLSLSHRKIRGAGNSDKVKQGWARVIVSAVSTYGSLLKDEELEFRVIAVEQKLKNSILIPKPQHDGEKNIDGKGETRINSEIRGSLSRKRVTVSLKYLRKPIRNL